MNRITFLIFSTITVICVFMAQPKSTQVECKNVTESVIENVTPIVVDTNIETTTNNTYYVTHYCSCYQCTGYEHNPDNVFGAEGVVLTPFVSVATNDFPFETQLLVTHENGTKEVWVVQDRGVSGHLDLYVGNSHEVALSIPNEYVTVEVFEPNHFDMEEG